MLVNSLGKNKIKISLTAFEITKLFGSYENIDYANPETKIALNVLLEKAVQISNTEFDDGALFVEVYPTVLGGCNIYFTRIKPEEKRPKRLKKVLPNSHWCILEFAQSNHLISAIQLLYKQNIPEILNSSLYKAKDTYCLLIIAAKPVMQKLGLIKEFTQNIYFGKENAAMLTEHSKTIVKSKAIQTIGKSFVIKI